MIDANKNYRNDLLRLRDILAPHGPLPISRSTWYAYVASGRAPQPVKLGPRVTAYRRADVEAFIADPRSWTAKT